jgi:hypothetical protein
VEVIALASPIVRETIKKLRDRQALLRKQVKGPLEELRQIEQDLEVLEATSSDNGRRRRGPAAGRAPRGANQAAILRAIRNGATTPEEIAEKTGIPARRVSSSLGGYVDKSKLVTQGINGLTLTKGGRDRLRELEAK